MEYAIAFVVVVLGVSYSIYRRRKFRADALRPPVTVPAAA